MSEPDSQRRRIKELEVMVADRICVDTGCGLGWGGPLTAVMLPERRFFSAI